VGILRAAYANRVAGGSSRAQLDHATAGKAGVSRQRPHLRPQTARGADRDLLEARLGKDEVLTRYLNRVYLGGGAYGMTAAARFYFDKTPPT